MELKPETSRLDIERSKKIKGITTKLSESGNFEYYLELVAFSEKLEKKYPNAREKYIIFHDLIGSGVWSTSEVIYDDFPGEDSVEKFVEYLAKKYKIAY
jgi:hypothetical protein